MKREGVIQSMYYNRAVMKQEVKQAMRRTRPHPMLVTLLYLVLVSVVAGLISSFTNILLPGGNALLTELIEGILEDGEYYLDYVMAYRPEMLVQLMIQSTAVSLVVSILTTIWTGLMNAGYSGYCLDMVRGANPGVDRLFGGFPRAGSVILAYILVAVFTFLWNLLFGIGFGVLLGIAFVIGTNDSLAIFGVILIFIATILYAFALIWVIYRYAMVPFAVIDSQTPLSALDAIRTSKTIMKGRKGSFFVLHLSFIGWYLLEYVVMLVGVIVSLVAAAGTITMYADRIEEMLYYGYPDLDWLMSILAPMLVFILPVILLCSVVIFIINLWLTPYRTGCEARFYVYAKGDAQPIQQSSYQPDPYRGQPGPYRGQPGPYGGQPGPYGGQPGP